jgi:ribosomal protein L3 glutamine methyltransferase
MARLSHTPRRGRPEAPTAEELWARVTRRLQRAHLHYGHGTDNARDEAAALLWHALGLPMRVPASQLRRRVTAAQREKLDALVARRIRERIPVVYLTHRCWFAGVELYVDERVLIPRSPLAELIERRFSPWIEARKVRRVLDLGTGSGCIAIACARAFRTARIDAVDVSADALAVARRNVHRHRLARRVHVRRSDYFSALPRGAYDIIVSNPPYVGRSELVALPPEYRHEPTGALAAGADGLDAVRVILEDAPRHLRAGGILVVEVGNTETLVRRRFARRPFTWLQFARGGGGVFLLTREQLDDGKNS